MRAGFESDIGRFYGSASPRNLLFWRVLGQGSARGQRADGGNLLCALRAANCALILILAKFCRPRHFRAQNLL